MSKAPRFFVGRRTTAFDVLDDPLLVVEHLEGVALGGVTQAKDGAAVETVQSSHEKGTNLSGHRAFPVEHGGVYHVQGIEHRPMPVDRYVRYDQDKGFVDVTEAEFTRLATIEAEKLPALVGTDNQLKWANDIRERVVESLTQAGRADLIPILKRRKYATFYISHDKTTIEQWIVLISQITATERTS